MKNTRWFATLVSLFSSICLAVSDPVLTQSGESWTMDTDPVGHVKLKPRSGEPLR